MSRLSASEAETYRERGANTELRTHVQHLREQEKARTSSNWTFERGVTDNEFFKTGYESRRETLER
eukprot:6492211-Amphidinium_carterae.1